MMVKAHIPLEYHADGAARRYVWLSRKEHLIRDTILKPSLRMRNAIAARSYWLTEILGVILAGGRASRIGGSDKASLELSDRTPLGHVPARLSPQYPDRVINANGDAMRFVRFELPKLAETLSVYRGPLAGVLAGLDWGCGTRG